VVRGSILVVAIKAPVGRIGVSFLFEYAILTEVKVAPTPWETAAVFD
jgi:hypothetical protein